MSSISFAVVIPMYNEEPQATACVRLVCAELAKHEHRSALIVVNDGSADGTARVLTALHDEFDNLIVIEHETNQGYGAGLRTGAQAAIQGGYDYALFMDSDLTNDPADIPKFVAKMEAGIDVIKASRYSGGGGTKGIPFRRYIISRIGNLIAKLLCRLPLSDLTNGFRAVKTNILAKCELKENNFSIIMEELYFCKYLAESFCHVPVVLTNRSEDIRQTSFSYKPSIFRDYLRYPLRCFFGLRPD